MVPWNPHGVYLSETAAFRHGERSLEHMSPHVSLGLCKQDAASLSQGVVNHRDVFYRNTSP